MVDFKKLRENSGKSSLEKLNNELEKLNGGYGNADPRFWYPNVDKAGNGYAVIRFLPSQHDADQDVPFVRLYSHSFQGPSGLWYIENSRTTLRDADPVAEYNSKLWNSGIESDKDLARKYGRKAHFICNIFVVTDKQNPENEGQVKLFKFGKKLFVKINEAMNPPFPDQAPFNPFDMWSGANFAMRIKTVEGYRNYDASSFNTNAPLATDDEMEAIYRQTHLLNAFVATDQFKPYDELKARFEKVLGIVGDAMPQPRATLQQDTAQPRQAPQAAAPVFKTADDVDDEARNWFASLQDND